MMERIAEFLKMLEQKGYRLTRATAVDLFPGTSHVETVVALHRTDS